MPRAKKCKSCGEVFTPTKPLQLVCGYECAITYMKSKIDSAAKKAAVIERREDKLKLKTRADWLREAQVAFNKYIRERDIDQPCISCQRHHEGQYHAGHYLTRGARPELRFHEDNCHKQCSVCNNHLSGNLVLYRANLIKKIGLEKVEWLEGNHVPTRYTVDDLKTMIAKYRDMVSKRKGV